MYSIASSERFESDPLNCWDFRAFNARVTFGREVRLGHFPYRGEGEIGAVLVADQFANWLGKEIGGEWYVGVESIPEGGFRLTSIVCLESPHRLNELVICELPGQSETTHRDFVHHAQ